MPVYIAAALQLLLYLLCMPVHIALRAEGIDSLRLGVGIAAFDRRAARRRALRRRRRGRQRTPRPGRLWRAALRLRLARVSVSGSLCLGDAALTALACGALAALARGIAVRADRARIDLRPDFAGERLRFALSGMVSARAGQIMIAILKAKLEGSKLT